MAEPVIPGDVVVVPSTDQSEVVAPSVAPTKPPLRKPTFVKISALTPDSRGINVIVKVMSVDMKSETQKRTGGATTSGGGGINRAEAVVGDDTGVITLLLKNDQLEVCQPGRTIVVRNGHIKIVKTCMRLEVDKWGKLIVAEKDAAFAVHTGCDMSSVEYELVRADS